MKTFDVKAMNPILDAVEKALSFWRIRSAKEKA